MEKFVFSKVARLVPGSFYLNKKPANNTIFTIFLLGKNLMTESCRLSACNFTKKLILKALQCIRCRFCTHKWNFMPARRCNVIWKFELLCDCMFAMYDCMLSYLDVEYYSFHNNIIGFIITLLVSYVWKVCNETMLPFVDSIFLCSLFTRHFNSQYLKITFQFFSQCSIQWTVVNFKNQWRNQYWKRAFLYKNYKLKCLNTK